MSFSSKVKEELSKLNTLSNNQVNQAELVGYLLTTNANTKKGKISYSTENEYNINRFNKLLLNLNIDYNIKLQGKTYNITFKNKYDFLNSLLNVEDEILKKAIIRGTFLGAGSVSNPKVTYHLEIIFSNETYLEFTKNILKTFNINCKTTKRNKKHLIYLKDGEDISNFLAIIGATSSVLKFEEERVIRDMKNNVNRLVNCETANLTKTINASVNHINDINYLKQIGKFEKLQDNLKEIANKRLENPDLSLIELGKLLNPPIGKSGVSHRLRKISDIANEYRGNKDE